MPVGIGEAIPLDVGVAVKVKPWSEDFVAIEPPPPLRVPAAFDVEAVGLEMIMVGGPEDCEDGEEVWAGFEVVGSLADLETTVVDAQDKTSDVAALLDDRSEADDAPDVAAVLEVPNAEEADDRAPEETATEDCSEDVPVLGDGLTEPELQPEVVPVVIVEAEIQDEEIPVVLGAPDETADVEIPEFDVVTLEVWESDVLSAVVCEEEPAADEESKETNTELDLVESVQAELPIDDDDDRLTVELSCDAVMLGDWDAELEAEETTVVAAEVCHDCHEPLDVTVTTGDVVDSSCDVDAVRVPELVATELGDASGDDDQNCDGNDADAEDTEVNDSEPDDPEDGTTGPEVDETAEDSVSLVVAEIEVEVEASGGDCAGTEKPDEPAVVEIIEDSIAEDSVSVLVADVRPGVEESAEDASQDDCAGGDTEDAAEDPDTGGDVEDAASPGDVAGSGDVAGALGAMLEGAPEPPDADEASTGELTSGAPGPPGPPPQEA
ncbi:hypothetical protein ST47_g229 [Ascochyta rabiei]|uniref:Uncharacterized protein n=1 Tax=Didymella rabiei TaxID=5454 RepID=A0A163MDS5_DIDRA|nr:hypothetical protein ST47_g229 [Ascochyta rabiei]